MWASAEFNPVPPSSTQFHPVQPSSTRFNPSIQSFLGLGDISSGPDHPKLQGTDPCEESAAQLHRGQCETALFDLCGGCRPSVKLLAQQTSKSQPFFLALSVFIYIFSHKEPHFFFQTRPSETEAFGCCHPSRASLGWRLISPLRTSRRRSGWSTTCTTIHCRAYPNLCYLDSSYQIYPDMK